MVAFLGSPRFRSFDHQQMTCPPLLLRASDRMRFRIRSQNRVAPCFGLGHARFVLCVLVSFSFFQKSPQRKRKRPDSEPFKKRKFRFFRRDRRVGLGRGEFFRFCGRRVWEHFGKCFRRRRIWRGRSHRLAYGSARRYVNHVASRFLAARHAMVAAVASSSLCAVKTGSASSTSLSSHDSTLNATTPAGKSHHRLLFAFSAIGAGGSEGVEGSVCSNVTDES